MGSLSGESITGSACWGKDPFLGEAAGMTKCVAGMMKGYGFPRVLKTNFLGEEGKEKQQRTG